MYQNTKGDTLITITPTQLKITNLIFTEHKYLLKENDLLQEKIKEYKSLTSNLIETSNLKEEKISEFNTKIKSQQLENERINKEIDKLVKHHTVDLCISGALAVAVFVLLVFK